MSATEPDSIPSAEHLRAIDVHAALDRRQDARRTLALADRDLQAATSAFDTGLDDGVDSRQLSLLDTDVEAATSAHASALWDHAESEVALVGAAGRSLDTRRGPRARQYRATFPAVPRAVAQVRELLRGHLDGTLEPDLLDDVALMAGEVAIHCLQHDDPARITVELDVRTTSRHQLTVTVTVSGGDAPLPDSAAWPPGAVDVTLTGGHGLAVLDSLAHVWGTQRRHRRTSVWFSVTAAVASRGLDQDAVDQVERAAAVLADAAAVAAEAEARVLLEYEDAARRAAADAQAAVSAAAGATARAVEIARRSRAAAASTAATAAAGLATASARAVLAQQASDRARQPAGAAPDRARTAASLAAATLAAAVVADAVHAAAVSAHDLDTRAARTDARRAADAAVRVQQTADTAAEEAAHAVAAGVSRLRDAAAARREVYETRFLGAVQAATAPPTPD